jgi:CheY-like chemotaxis protein
VPVSLSREGARIERPDSQADLPRCRPLHLLVAEDNPVNQKLVLRLLDKHGHTGEIAADGRAALAVLERGHFDGVLMDIQMPELDGIQVTTRFRAREPAGQHLPIIAMTAHARAGDRIRCLEAGMDAYLSKPLDAAEFFHLLATVVGPSSRDAPATEPAVATLGPAVLNLAAALERVGGDQQLFHELCEICLTNLPAWMNEVRSALAAQNASSLRRSAHSIKGAVGSVGGDQAAVAALRMEERGRDSQFDGATSDLSALEGAVARLESHLRHIESAATVLKETHP